MATVAELLVKISGDSSDLRKEIAASQRQLRRGFGSDALELSSGAAGILAGLTAAAAAAGAAAIKMSADYTASKTAFTTLLGDAQKAENMLADLATFAADTPFELPGLIKASQKLMAFGFASEDIIPIMSAVGDAISLVGGGQEAIDGVVRALGQIQAKGKLSAEEMNQLAERGINGWKYISEAMGVSTAEAMKMAEQGAIDSTTAINAVVNGMQTNFVGGMDAMSKTVPGLLSTIKDNAGMLLKELGDNLTTALDLQGLLTNVATFLTQFTSVVKSAGVKEAIQSLIPPEITAAVFALSGALVAVAIPAMYAFAVSTWAAIAPLAPFIAAGIAVGLLAYEIWNNWEPLCELFDALWSTVSQLFSDYWNVISDVVSSCWDYITGVINDSVGWVLDYISAGWDTVTEITSSVWSGVSDFMSSAWQSIKSIVAEGVQWVLNAMQPLLDLVSSVLPEGIKTMFSNLGAGIDRVKSSLSGLKLGSSGVENLIPEPNKPNTKFTGLHGSAANAATSGAGGGGGGGKSAAEKEYEKLEKAAEQTSKRIQKEWMQLTGARIDALDSWRNDELEKLNESASVNENYERDLQRLNEIYSHKKIKILYDEEKERNSIFDNAYEAAKDLQERMSKLSLPVMTNASGGIEASKVAAELQNIENEYDDTITKIQNRYRDLSATYVAATSREQAIYLDAWAKNGIAFEVNEQGKVDFKKQIDKEMVTSEQEKDQKIRAINVARKRWEESQESARNAGDIAAFQATLSDEQALLAQDLAGRQAYIDEFYTLWRDAHKSSMAQMAESMGDFQSGMTDIFMNIGSEIKSAGDFFKSFGDLVLKTILKIQAQAAATSITQSLFGTGGWLRGILGGGTTNAASSAASVVNDSVVNALDMARYATGGLITGPGTPTSDNIPIWASPGEGILNANAVRMIGVNGLNALNSGTWPRFATGGIVAGPSLGSLSGSYFNTSRPSASTASPNVTVNVINNTGTQATATASQPRFDGQKYIIDVVMDAYNRNVGGMRTVMANGRG